jgi:F0F1-type ATP synthase membrane subunit b/b'
VLVFLKVPGLIGGMLDKRAEGIKAELDEARAIREEAQTLLASYERKQKKCRIRPTASWPMPRWKPPRLPRKPRKT